MRPHLLDRVAQRGSCCRNLSDSSGVVTSVLLACGSGHVRPWWPRGCSWRGCGCGGATGRRCGLLLRVGVGLAGAFVAGLLVGLALSLAEDVGEPVVDVGPAALGLWLHLVGGNAVLGHEAGRPAVPLLETLRVPLLETLRFSSAGRASIRMSANGASRRAVKEGMGTVTAPARVLGEPQDFGQMQPGDVLVASITTPACSRGLATGARTPEQRKAMALVRARARARARRVRIGSDVLKEAHEKFWGPVSV
jgi:hypothetical protein